MTRVSRRLEVVALPAALVLLAACGDLGTEPGVRASAATASAGGFGVCNADFPDLAGWNKVFEDKFDQAALSKWKIWYGGAFNNELQLYQEANLEGEGSGQLSPRLCFRWRWPPRGSCAGAKPPCVTCFSPSPSCARS